jgi:23S rRNA (pseudouridine1915-N3)-methyltransferase
MQLKFRWIGKTKSAPIRSLVEDYLGRLRHWTSCEIVEIPDSPKRRPQRQSDALAAGRDGIGKCLSGGGKLVVLDERGKQFSSVDFSRWFDEEMQRGTRSIVFAIGGPDGLDEATTKSAHLRLSLGKMTWTHEMCRVLLLEQVYRAFTIIRKFPYHK